MSTTAEMQARPLKRGQKVRLVEDIPGHKAGSEGKVAIANGVTWLRYWVRFIDGSSVGHIDHSALVKAKDYDQFLHARDAEALAAEMRASQPSEESDQSSGGAAAAGSGGGATVNGVAIPQLLLDRSKAARARLGA